MARARNIKPSFFKNELLVEMGPFDRLLFIGLWCLADREGRIEDRPKRIKMELFPCDTYDVDKGLEELESHGFVTRYQAAGVRVISIVNFLKHQTPHGTEKDSDLPDETGAMTVHERNPNGYVTGNKRKNNVNPPEDNGALTLGNSVSPVQDQGENTLNPDSLNPDSLNPDSLGKSRKRSAPTRATQIPPDFYPNEAGVTYAEERRVSLAIELQSFRNHHQAKGTTFKDWQAAWRTWCDKAVEFGRAGPKAIKPIQPQETAFQRTQRETIEGLAPGVARRPVFDTLTVIEGGAHVAAIESR